MAALSPENNAWFDAKIASAEKLLTSAREKVNKPGLIESKKKEYEGILRTYPDKIAKLKQKNPSVLNGDLKTIWDSYKTPKVIADLSTIETMTQDQLINFSEEIQNKGLQDKDISKFIQTTTAKFHLEDFIVDYYPNSFYNDLLENFLVFLFHIRKKYLRLTD